MCFSINTVTSKQLTDSSVRDGAHARAKVFPTQVTSLKVVTK